MKQDRITRVNRLLQETLAEMIHAVKDPRVARASVLSVVGVQTTPDLRHAKVYLSIAGEERVQHEALAGLNHARGYLRTELGRAVRLRCTPELHFVIDETIERAARIEGILREIADEEGSDDGSGEAVSGDVAGDEVRSTDLATSGPREGEPGDRAE
jgi:ribosome-binding factor A